MPIAVAGLRNQQAGSSGVPLHMLHLLLHAATASMVPSSLACNAPICAGERIAFEVDGPHHFTANTLAVTGEMLARQKLLRARGWAVVSVPFFHWAGRADEARAHWLLQARLQLPPASCCHSVLREVCRMFCLGQCLRAAHWRCSTAL